MSENISELLQAESDAIEADPDAPIGPNAEVSRGHDLVKPLRIRLNEDEFEQIEQLAETRGLPVSTLARSILLAAIDDYRTAVIDRVPATAEESSASKVPVSTNGSSTVVGPCVGAPNEAIEEWQWTKAGR